MVSRAECEIEYLKVSRVAICTGCGLLPFKLTFFVFLLRVESGAKCVLYPHQQAVPLQFAWSRQLSSAPAIIANTWQGQVNRWVNKKAQQTSWSTNDLINKLRNFEMSYFYNELYDQGVIKISLLLKFALSFFSIKCN